MNDLFDKFYKRIIFYEQERIIAGKRLDEEVNNLIEPYKNKLSKEEMEQLRTLIYSASYTAEYEGFKLGAKSIIYILREILSP